jgi:gluconate kinase
MPASLLDSQLGTLESLGPTERGSTIANQGSLTAVIEAAAKVVGRE